MISTHGLKKGLNEQLFETAVHELTHKFGVQHCPKKSALCVMRKEEILLMRKKNFVLLAKINFLIKTRYCNQDQNYD